MMRLKRIESGNIVVLKDLVSRRIGVIKICKTKPRLCYGTYIEYIAEEEMGRHGEIINVSDISPIAKSLIGQRAGNVIKVYFPTGKVRKYYILDVKH